MTSTINNREERQLLEVFLFLTKGDAEIFDEINTLNILPISLMRCGSDTHTQHTMKLYSCANMMNEEESINFITALLSMLDNLQEIDKSYMVVNGVEGIMGFSKSKGNDNE